MGWTHQELLDGDPEVVLRYMRYMVTEKKAEELKKSKEAQEMEHAMKQMESRVRISKTSRK